MVAAGGGRERTDASIFECAARETMEETGVAVAGSTILYVQEFVDHTHGARNVEVFILADSPAANAAALETRAPNHDLPSIAEVGWFTQERMQAITVFPACLKDAFWRDRLAVPIVTRHLGTVARG